MRRWIAILGKLEDDIVYRWQSGLQALVNCEGADRLGIFQAATQSVVRLLGYRFAGVGILGLDGFIDLACFWNTNRFAPTVRDHVFTGDPRPLLLRSGHRSVS